MSLNRFDHIIYINLDHRTDRNEDFLVEANRVGIDPAKLQRLPGIYDALNGSRGCILSHIEALKLAEKWETTLILEDDCIFVEELSELDEQIPLFFQTFKEAWDVFFLGGKYVEMEPTQTHSFNQIRNSIRSHAYAINRSYAKTLRNCFQKTYEEMQQDLFFMYSRGRMLDDAWEELQERDRWYAGAKPLAFQTDSYSDIELFHRSER